MQNASHHRFSRRAVLGAMGYGLAAVLLGAASAQTGQGAGSPPHLEDWVAARVRERFGNPPQTLNLLLPQGSGANVRPVITAFAQATGVVVNAVEVAVDDVPSELLLDQVLRAHRFDVALPATFALPDLVEAQAILPLDAYAATYEPPGFRQSSLYPVGDTYNDHLFGFQTDGDTYVMFYHRDMLQDPQLRMMYEDRFGQALEVPQSWEELDRQMAFFHAPQEGRYGGALFRVPQYLAWEWWIRFHAKGVWPLSPELVPQIAGEAGVTALEEMIRAGQSLVPEVKSMGLFDNWARYARGDVYANIGWGGTQKYLNGPGSAMRGRMIFGPTPGGGPGLGASVPYFNWGWSYVICAASTRPELAYLFSLFASTPRMSTLAVSQPDGFFDPFRPEHYEDPGIVAAYSAPFLKVQQAAMRGAIPDFYLQGRADYFAALTRWLDAALHQDVPPEVALRRVATAWDQITQRAGPEKQRRRWQQLRAKYPASMRLSLRDWNS